MEAQELKNAIKADLEALANQGLSLEMLIQDIKDDPDAYEYSIDDLEIYINENK